MSEGNEPDAVHGAGAATPEATIESHVGGTVFISYASADVAVADTVVAALENHGVTCWIAPRDVKAGALYAEAIVRAISDAKALVLVLSANSVASAHVGKEVERASSKRRPVIALRIDEAPLSPALEYFLSESHWIDARAGGMDAALAKLIAAIREPERAAPGIIPAVASGTSAGIASAPPPRSRRYRILLATGLAVVAVALAALLADRFWPTKHMAADHPTTATTTVIGDKSIAVLPFADMSEKKDQEYFADGLSEELIDLLTKVPDLRVPARTSSFYFKGKPTQMADIAKALNVSNVLEGSVRRSGSAVRITAHLVHVDTGYDVWSQTYDRDMKDIFQAQDEIAGAVVQALKLQLLSNGLGADRTSNVDAYSLLLQGRFFIAQYSEADLRNAIWVLERAVALDQSYAPAWAELAHSYVNLAGYVDSAPAHDMEAARAAVQKALALNPADAAAHYLLATIKITFEHDWDGAVTEMDAARRADPNLTTPVELVLVTGCNSGPCHDKYIRDISRDIERDPLNAGELFDRAYAYYYSGDLDAAESDMRRGLDVSPNLLVGKYSLGLLLMARRKPAEALPVMENLPDSLYRRAGLALVYQALGRKPAADAALQELLAKDSQDGPFQIAEVFSARGNKSAALDWLQRDYDLKMYGILDAKADPLLRPLAREPRFIALMNKFAPSQ